MYGKILRIICAAMLCGLPLQPVLTSAENVNDKISELENLVSAMKNGASPSVPAKDMSIDPVTGETLYSTEEYTQAEQVLNNNVVASEAMPIMDQVPVAVEARPSPVMDIPSDAPAVVSVSEDKVWAGPTLHCSDESCQGLKDSDVHKQEVKSLSDEMVIDKYFLEAKQTPLPQPEYKPSVPEEIQPSQTNEEIVKSLIPAEVKGQKIDLDFDEVKLGDIFMTLGKTAKINILMDPELKAQSTDLHLKQVPLEEVMVLLANAHNLGFKRVGDSLFVTLKEKITKENTVSKVIKLRNINVQEAKGMISELVKTVNVGEETNSLIVIGQPEEILRAESILKTIDRPQPQVILEARVIEVNRDALKDLGVDWSDTMNLSYQEANRPSTFGTTEDAPASPFQIYGFSRSPMQFSQIIKMLENQNKAKVLSAPRVSTLNNKEAEIFVGDRFPYTVTTISGGVATTDVRFEEPGIRLKITPSIIDDEFVVIKVEPEVSFIFGFRGPDDQYPWTKKRQALANVRVKNNQPFILGGILNQEDKKNLYKVPFIGNVPLLGNLFSYKKDTVVDTELIITIVPTIVKGEI